MRSKATERAPSAACSGVQPMACASGVKPAATTAASIGSRPEGPNTAGKHSDRNRPSNRLASVTVSGPPRR